MSERFDLRNAFVAANAQALLNAAAAERVIGPSSHHRSSEEVMPVLDRARDEL